MQKFNVNEFAAKVNNHINEATTQGFLEEASPIEEALYFTLKYNTLLEGDYLFPSEIEGAVELINSTEVENLLTAYVLGWDKDGEYFLILNNEGFFKSSDIKEALSRMREHLGNWSCPGMTPEQEYKALELLGLTREEYLPRRESMKASHRF